MNSSTGVACCSALIECCEGRLGDLRSSAGALRSRSIRSLSGPGLLISVLRSRIVGRASLQQRAQLARGTARGPSSRGLEAATSSSRSSSVARRLTNVVLALRSVPRQQRRAPGRATRSRRAIAPTVVFALRDQVGEVVAARGQRAPSSCAVLTRKRVERLLVGDDLVDQPRGRAQRRVEVLRRLVGLRAACRRTTSREPWMTCCSAVRVLGSSVLKSWSRSTIDVVVSVPERRAVGELRALSSGPGVSAM